MTSMERLAIDGGTPVRDTVGRPWSRWPPVSEEEWNERVGPRLREVYLSGTEGLPGPRAAAFAARFAAWCGARHGRLLVHGTDAIAAALSAALDLDVGAEAGELILPDYTFIASASAPLDRGFTLAFVDIDPATFTLDPDAVEAAIRPGVTRAILAVHLAGHPADMDRINAIARRHGLAVIEDAAQAHGAAYRGRRVGALADAAAFSFQSSKNLTCGEGGLVTTNSPDIDARVLAFMDVGRHPRGERWAYPRLGWNYRPSEYLAALLDVRMDGLEDEMARRERTAARLDADLARIPGVTPPRKAPWCTRHAWHLYCLQVDPEAFGGRSRDEIVRALAAEGIPASAGYARPLTEQPGIARLAAQHPDRIRAADLPHTRRACARSVWLLQQVLLGTDRDADDIVEAFAKVQRAFAGGA